MIARILNGDNYLFQWDTNVKIAIDDKSATNVDFANKNSDIAYTTEIYDYDGMRVAEIPNILLQDKENISMYICRKDGISISTLKKVVFKVINKEKPNDYVCQFGR